MGGIVDAFYRKAQQQPRTPFVETKIRPGSVPEDVTKSAPMADENITQIFHSLKIAQKNLQDLDATLKATKSQYEAQVNDIKTKEGYEKKAAELQTRIEELRTALTQISTAENVVVSLNDQYIALENKTREVAFKSDDKWKVTKLLEKYGAEAEKYLQSAINGAQSLATTVPDVRLVQFPKKSQTENVVSAISANILNFTKSLMMMQSGIEHILGAA